MRCRRPIPGVRAAVLAALAGLLALAAAGPAHAAPAKTGAVQPVRISMLYPGGSNNASTYNTKFIELFNPNSVAVSIGGWSIQYGSATGTTGLGACTNCTSVLPDGASIKPCGYYLVGLASVTTGTPLPVTLDAGPFLTSPSGSNGKIGLVSQPDALNSCSGAALQDLVGWGTANCWGGTAAAVGLGGNYTIELVRKNAGMSNTGSNSTDFDSLSVSLNLPRNSSSPAPAACQGTSLTAVPGGPYSGTVGAAISFNGGNSIPPAGGTITNYAWTFGDGGTASGASASATHTYAATGTYTVKLTVTGSTGGTNTDSTTATITGGQVLTAHAGGPYSGTVGNAISFNGSGSTPPSGGGITAYAWTFGDGGTGTGATPTHTYTAAGTYTVKLTVTGSTGGNSLDSTTATVSTAPPPSSAKKLLFQAVCVGPTAGEFVAIYNPNDVAVDLSNYYLTDAVFAPSEMYPYIVNPSPWVAAGSPPGTPGGGAFFDFHARFPAGATIAAHDTIAVSHQGTQRFLATYGRKPAFDFSYPGLDDPTVPHMRPAFYGAIPSVPDSATLSNGGESVVLYYWDGQSALVTDIDYAFWGTNTGTYVVNKTGITLNGQTYQPDTPAGSQVPIASTGHANGSMFRREDFTEGTQKTSGGNGVGGRDETSENLGTTWSSTNPAVPPVVKAGPPPVTLKAHAGGPYASAVGVSILFNGSTSVPPQGGTITAYNWVFGDGNIGSGPTVNHAYTAAGAYRVILTVTGSTGGTSSDTTTATVSDTLQANAGGP
ncbi:MAG TPA: PKD domain-containing protein, partial [Candidatus Saccharimonadales bacterium]|nr:PKD domain-containing protein [Candidatus Saccharimonadales bacterium]